MEMAKEAYTPRLTMQKWIEEAPYTASVSSGKLKSLEDLKFKTPIYKEAGGSLVEWETEDQLLV